MIDIRFPEMFKNLKQFETLIGLMEIGHTAGVRDFSREEDGFLNSGPHLLTPRV